MLLKRILSAVACCGLLAAAGSCRKDSPAPEPEPEPDPTVFDADVVYDYDDSYFINPEKGMYLTNVYYFRNGEVPEAASVEHMRSFRDRNMSLSFSQFYLIDFLERELSGEVLSTIRDDFENHRAAGLKTIVRFCYNYTGAESDSEKEPEVDLVLRHVEQVKPLLREYSDIIYVMQAGFIGSWGEWSISTHFKNDSDRRKVVDALLDALPVTRQIALRTPSFKTRVFDTKLRDTITLATAFDGSPLSRVGGHNDCFLANASDAGTFGSSVGRVLWQSETRYTIMGGETCIPDPSYCNCTGGMKALEDYHWSYLNSAYNTKALALLEEDGCMEDIYKRLGYRLSLEKAAFDGKWTANGQIRIRINVKNNGFASLMNPRLVEFVIEKKNDKSIKTVIPTETDPRYWQAGTVSFWDSIIDLPETLQEGEEYNLYLNLPDPAPTLYANPEFSVRLANKDMWDEFQGYNLIYSFTAENKNN